MHILFDIVLLALFAFLMLRGYFRGFIKTVLSFGRLVLAVLVTLIFGAAFSGWIDKTFVNPPVFDFVYGKLYMLAGDAVENISEFVSDLPTALKGFVDSAALEEKYGAAGVSADVLVTDVATSVSGAVSSVISTVIGYVLLFALSFVVLTVVIFILNKVVKLPVIKTGDRILGLVLGVVSGLIAVSLVSAILYAIIYVSGNMEIYERSLIFKLVQRLNVFGFVFDRLLG